MARKHSSHLRLPRLKRPVPPAFPRPGTSTNSEAPPPREPQIVDRRGTIAALVQDTPRGYEVLWRLAAGSHIRDLDRRGPYQTRALAICWARVGLMLREEAWRAIHFNS